MNSVIIKTNGAKHWENLRTVLNLDTCITNILISEMLSFWCDFTFKCGKCVEFTFEFLSSLHHTSWLFPLPSDNLQHHFIKPEILQIIKETSVVRVTPIAQYSTGHSPIVVLRKHRIKKINNKLPHWQAVQQTRITQAADAGKVRATFEYNVTLYCHSNSRAQLIIQRCRQFRHNVFIVLRLSRWSLICPGNRCLFVKQISTQGRIPFTKVRRSECFRVT